MSSSIWNKNTIKEIRDKAKLGRYRIRGYGTNRLLPNFDDLVFVPAQLTRLAIDSYRESVSTKTVLGARFAKQPLELSAPILIAPMSYGAVSKEAKVALAKAAARLGVADSTGEGGMLPAQRAASKYLFYQCTPGRYGFSLGNLLSADAVEIVEGQGAKPGSGGQLMAEKVTSEIASLRQIPMGVDLRSPSRHPDMFGGDDLRLKIEEIRTATRYKVPISVKIGAGRVREDVKIAAKCGADIIAIDGMQGGTGAGPDVLIEHAGIPTLAALPMAVEALQELGLEEKIDLVVMGGIRNGADAAKALALGAKAVAVGTGALIAIGCIACQDCATDTCALGICTQDEQKRAKLDVEEAAEKAYRWLKSVVAEIEMIAKICGKTDLHNLEPEDLRSLTLEASLITGVPLIGTNDSFDLKAIVKEFRELRSDFYDFVNEYQDILDSLKEFRSNLEGKSLKIGRTR